jgi:DNA-binding NtrC family response regulator
MARILIVDDDPKVLKLLETLLRADGQSPVPAGDGMTALNLLEGQSIDLVISDVRMAPMDGMELLSNIHAKWPHVPVILLTAYGAFETAQSAMQKGAFDYLTKPFRVDELVSTVKRALSEAQKKAELAGLRHAEQPCATVMNAIVAESDAMRRVCEQVRRVAPTDASVLFTGESGTGKEMLARQIHINSRRRDKLYASIHCASLTAHDMEIELFGILDANKKGTAAPARPGLLVAAQGGTLFLDEVSSLSPMLQEKLLHVMRDRQMTPLGGTAPITTNVRILSASDVKLEERVQQGYFLPDLYLRLGVIALAIPPLRERPEDILPMVQHFMRSGRCEQEASPRLNLEVADLLTHYPWPGNVRELGNAVRHAMAFMPGDEVTMDSLPPRISAHALEMVKTAMPAGGGRGRHAFLRSFLQHQADPVTASEAGPTVVIPAI